MTKAMSDVLTAVSAVMKSEPVPELNEEACQEAKAQSVYPLICTDSLAMKYISNNVRLMWEQQQLANVFGGIPYVILKGSCAAIYYPQPIRRALGDIDILVDPKHFNSAQGRLEKAGYLKSDSDDRHIHYRHNDVTIELHKRFATLNTAKQEELLDEWLYFGKHTVGKIGKYSFPMPADDLNGLVLLTHINQHLEEGLGLRQILDWLMYVKHSLPDDRWLSFKEKTDTLGLTLLAKTIAKFGQEYLKLNQEITWCLDADDKTVEKLVDYIIECGDFGRKDAPNNTVIMIMSHGRGVWGIFKNLQERGLKNWKSVQRHNWLRPFAWIYQLCRYVTKGLQKKGIKSLRDNIKASNKRNMLLDELGLRGYSSRKGVINERN